MASESHDRRFQRALHFLLREYKRQKPPRTEDVESLWNVVKQDAYAYGIVPNSILQILEAVISLAYLPQTLKRELINCIIPREDVPSQAVLTVAAALGQGNSKPANEIQALLVEWLSNVSEYVDDQQIFNQIYGVLFNLLDMIAIRAPLCSILVRVTTKKHVKPYRLRLLLELCRCCEDSCLLKLLEKFSEYVSDHIPAEFAGRRSNIPRGECLMLKNSRQAFTDRCLQIRRNADVGSASKISASLSGSPSQLQCEAKTDIIPVQDLRSLQDLVKNLEHIRLLPNQKSNVISEPLAQQYLSLISEQPMHAQFEKLLRGTLENVLEGTDNGGREGEELGVALSKVLSFVRHSAEIPKPVLSFLSKYLEHWQGDRNRDKILGLLSYLSLQPFKEAHSALLQKIEEALFPQQSSGFVAVLKLYSTIQRHWRHQILNSTATSASIKLYETSIMLLVDRSFDIMIHMLMADSVPSESTKAAILDCLSTVAETASHARDRPDFRIQNPPTLLIYRLFFSADSMSSFSPLTATLARYKKAYEEGMAHGLILPSEVEISGHYSKQYINALNGFLTDLCNLLWRNRAFNSSDINALGCLLPEEVLSTLRTYADAMDPPQPLNSLFSLSNHPAVLALSAAAFRDLEQRVLHPNGVAEGHDGASRMDTNGAVPPTHAGPVTARSLQTLAQDGGAKTSWTEYRLHVLRWLDDRGIQGPSELIFCTIKNLTSAGHASAASAATSAIVHWGGLIL